MTHPNTYWGRRRLAIEAAARAILVAARGLTAWRMAWVSNRARPGWDYRGTGKREQARSIAEWALGFYTRNDDSDTRIMSFDGLEAVEAWGRKTIAEVAARYAERHPDDSSRPFGC